MEDLETNQIFSRQEIDPQPQVVCRRELLPPNWHLKGQAGAPLAAASPSWQLCCLAMWKEPVPGSAHAKLVAAAGKTTFVALGHLCPVRPGIRGFMGRSSGRVGVSICPCQGL